MSARNTVRIGEREVGAGRPTYVVAEIGINHNGDLDLAKRLVDAARLAGCDAVKLQKRTPEKCVPEDQRDVPRETPWGMITYLEYRKRVELGREQYDELNRYCKAQGIDWFASVWDEGSVDFLEPYRPVAYKVPSALITDHALLRKLRATGRPRILSTGMSTPEQIRAGVAAAGTEDLVLLHSTSTYPCPPDELNLRMIETLAREYDCPIGYSGHEVGLQTTVAAVALGATMIERHVTLDRAMWGTDQAASVEPWGLMRLVRDVRVLERALGDGVKRVYPSEQKSMVKLRRVR